MNRRAASSSSCLFITAATTSGSSFFRDCWSCHHISDPAILLWFHRSKQPHNNSMYKTLSSFFSYKRILTVSRVEPLPFFWIKPSATTESWSSSVAPRKKTRRRRRRSSKKERLEALQQWLATFGQNNFSNDFQLWSPCIFFVEKLIKKSYSWE